MSKKYTKYLILKKLQGGYKGLFSELDTINEYSQEFDRILGKYGETTKGIKQAILEFFDTFLPCVWSESQGRYVSLFSEWVAGEVNLVSNMPDYEEWDSATKKEVAERMKVWQRYLIRTSRKRPHRFKPQLSVTKGTNLLLPD